MEKKRLITIIISGIISSGVVNIQNFDQVIKANLNPNSHYARKLLMRFEDGSPAFLYMIFQGLLKIKILIWQLLTKGQHKAIIIENLNLKTKNSLNIENLELFTTFPIEIDEEFNQDTIKLADRVATREDVHLIEISKKNYLEKYYFRESTTYSEKDNAIFSILIGSGVIIIFFGCAVSYKYYARTKKLEEKINQYFSEKKNVSIEIKNIDKNQYNNLKNDDKEFEIDKMLTLVAKNKIESAFSNLEYFIRLYGGLELSQQITSLRARFNSNNEMFIQKSIIKYEDYLIENNKLTQALIQLIQNVDKSRDQRINK